MAIRLTKPPIASGIAPGTTSIDRSWSGWFSNLYDCLSKSNVLLDIQSASSSSQLNFVTSITNSFSKFRLDLEGLTFSAASGILQLRVSTNTGSSFDSGGSAYEWGAESIVLTTTTAYNSDGLTADSKIQLCVDNTVSTATYTLNGSIEFYNPSASNPTMFVWDLAYRITGGDLCRVRGVGQYLSSTPVNGIQIFPASGTITAGRVVLTGIN